MDSQPVSAKKSIFKRWWFWAIIGIIIVLIILGSGNSGTTDQTPVAAQDSGACATPLSTLKGEAQPITYKELEKDPTSYNGQVANFTGQVLEIEQDGDNGVMRLSVTNEGDGFWSSNDVIYVTYEGTTTPVQDDIVTITGTLTGTYSYTSEANYQITLPSMDTCGSDIHEASSKATDSAPTTVSAAPVQPTAPASVVTTPSPSPQPATPTAAWHTAYTYSGNTLTQTPAFSMQGSQWKITYTCSPDPDASSSGVQPYFQGWVADTNTNSEASLFANDVDCPSSQTSYAYSQPPGQYYLNVGSLDADYTVTVSDYY